MHLQHIVADPRLLAQVGEKEFECRQLLPDLWQERRLVAPFFQDDTIFPRPYFGFEIITVAVGQRLRWCQQRDLHAASEVLLFR